MEQRDGGYYIAGSRIALDCIILAFQDGESQETILCSFPMAGPLVRVYGAIVFYLENKEMIEAYMRDQERLWAEVNTTETALPEDLSARLRERPGNTRHQGNRDNGIRLSAEELPRLRTE